MILYSAEFKFKTKDVSIQLEIFTLTKGEVVGLCFARYKDVLQNYFNTSGIRSIVPHQRPTTLEILHELDLYVHKKLSVFSTPIHFLQASPFQLKVWKELRNIPYGDLRSYKYIAKALGYTEANMYARAVGNAVGANPIPILLPCHRVLHHAAYKKFIEHKKVSNHSNIADFIQKYSGEYSGGKNHKRYLLNLELSALT